MREFIDGPALPPDPTANSTPAFWARLLAAPSPTLERSEGSGQALAAQEAERRQDATKQGAT